MRTNRIHETIEGTGPVTIGGWVGCSSAKTSWMGLQVLTGVRERSTRTTWAVQLPRIDRKTTRYNLSGSSRLSGGGETFVPVVKDIGDEELVSRVAEGDDHALSELYDRYARQVYVTGIRLLKDSYLAEELVQDAFTNVWRGAGSFDRNRARFATWLYQITRNRATDLDRRRRVRPLSAGEEPLWNVSGGQDPEASVALWDIARALSRMSEEHREVLTLAYFEGLSQREISRRTGIPLGTVKSRTTAALKRLRRTMEDDTVAEARRE
jgi:RNA polymerase sigma-70 factor, ECF subfamily